MTRLMVFGSSDDLIEVREIGRYPDEILPGGKEYSIFYPKKSDPVELYFSDGSILTIWYGERDQGIWGISIVVQASVLCPDQGIVIVPAENDEGIYTDVAFLTAPEIKVTKCVYDGKEISE